jgi:hypothetical protein
MEEPADGHDENMHSSSQVAVAAVDLSYTEGSDVDILDVSIQNLSIHGKFVFNTFLVTLFSHFPPGLTPCWITNLAELSLPPSPFSPRHPTLKIHLQFIGKVVDKDTVFTFLRFAYSFS